MKTKYYLYRAAPHQRYTLSKTKLHDAENIGPFSTYAEAKAECDRLNALVVKPPRKQGRPAKGGWVRFEMRLNSEIHQRLTACAGETGENLTTAAERILDAGLQNKKYMYTRDELRAMLEDVVSVLDLSDTAMETHGPAGTLPAELVRLVLEQKDKEIAYLKAGLKKIENK